MVRKGARAAAGIKPEVLGVVVRKDDWFSRLPDDLKLSDGKPAPDSLSVPAGDAQRILRETVRFVADIPKGSSPDVVWVQGDSELLVRTAGIGLRCATGLVTIAIPVSCDQLTEDATVEVPLGVGQPGAPSGLVMSTLVRPTGPPVVVDAWAEALTAFAWEALVHLARSLSGAVGTDANGRPLVPAYVGAGAGVLEVQPMARHRISGARP